MHYILTTVGSAGDVHPIIALGIALQQRGHRVSVLTNAYFEERITGQGLEFLPLGTREEYLQVESDPLLWDAMKGFQYVVEKALLPSMRPMYDILAKNDPDETIVVATSVCFGARIAQEHLGFRLATLALQPCVLRSVYLAPVLPGPVVPNRAPRFVKQLYYWLGDMLIADKICCPEINKLRKELNLPPIRRIFDNWLHSPDLIVGLFPNWFAPVQPDWPEQLHLTNFPFYDAGDMHNLGDSVETFLQAGEPPVVFAPGSAMRYAGKFFRESVEAALLLGKRAILVSGEKSQLPKSLPDSIAWFPYVPFGSLLPRATALVHHGGIGTTAQALAAGIPQIVMPLAHDQPDNAARVQRLGVGNVLSPKRYTGPQVAETMHHLLSSSDVAAQCRYYADNLADNTALEDTCRLLDELGNNPLSQSQRL